MLSAFLPFFRDSLNKLIKNKSIISLAQIV